LKSDDARGVEIACSLRDSVDNRYTVAQSWPGFER
jgi:hypothetical protein